MTELSRSSADNCISHVQLQGSWGAGAGNAIRYISAPPEIRLPDQIQQINRHCVQKPSGKLHPKQWQKLHSVTLQQWKIHSFFPKTIIAWNHWLTERTTQSTRTVLSVLSRLWLQPSANRPPPLHTPTHCTNARFLDASDKCYRNRPKAYLCIRHPCLTDCMWQPETSDYYYSSIGRENNVLLLLFFLSSWSVCILQVSDPHSVRGWWLLWSSSRTVLQSRLCALEVYAAVQVLQKVQTLMSYRI